MDFTNYNISLKVPKEYVVNSDLNATHTLLKITLKAMDYSGKNRFDIELNITKITIL